MNKTSIKENYFFNILLLIFNTSFPLITAPYVSRVLGANNLGIVNYAYSIVSMFVVIAGFGVPVYGIRGVAKYKDDKEKLNEFVSNTLRLLIIITLFVALAYIIMIKYFFFNETETALYIMIIYLLSFPFSFEWFFIGIEQFKFITIRSVIIKIISLLFIFLFVKDRNDFLYYAVILSLSQSITFVINFKQSKRYWKYTSSGKNLKKYLQESSIFFLTILISSMFTIFDKVLVGFFTDHSSVAFYYRNRQITMMVIGITTSLVKVLTPRLSNLIHYNENTRYVILLNRSLQIFLFISIPSLIGLITLGKDLLFLFGGIEFLLGYDSFVILSIWTIFAGFNVFLDNQISIPNGKEYFTTISAIVIAIITIVLNVFLTPKFGILGASIALLSAESVGLILHSILLKKNNYLKMQILNIDNFKVIFSSFLMFVILIGIKKYTDFPYIKNILILIPVGLIVFFSSIMILKHNLITSYYNRLKSIYIKTQ